MRNLFAHLGLPVDATPDELRAALARVNLPEEVVGDIGRVLGTQDWRLHYERLHRQYLAMSATLARMDKDVMLDAGQWEKRLQDYLPDNERLR